jgi:hypothetical protein
VKPQRKLLLAVTVLIAAASFTLSRPAVGTLPAAPVTIAKVFGSS